VRKTTKQRNNEEVIERNTMINISPYNAKLACPSFSIPAKITCQTGLACWKYCYAAKIESYRPNVKKLYAENLLEASKDTFVDDMVKRIKYDFNPRYFRLHVSGDFFSTEYAEKWAEIARRLPDTIFYTYTKRSFMKDVKRPKNFVLYWSIDGLKEKVKGEMKEEGFDGVSYTTNDQGNCPNQSDKTIKCGAACSRCMKPNRFPVVFKKH
jgi:hypothetical protein